MSVFVGFTSAALFGGLTLLAGQPVAVACGSALVSYAVTRLVVYLMSLAR